MTQYADEVESEHEAQSLVDYIFSHKPGDLLRLHNPDSDERVYMRFVTQAEFEDDVCASS